MDPKSLGELGALLAAFGLLLWLVRRTFTVTIPRLADTFTGALDKVIDAAQKRDIAWREELREQRRESAASAERMQQAFMAEMKDQRQELLSRNKSGS